MKFSLKLWIFLILIWCVTVSHAQNYCGRQQSAHQLIYGGQTVSEGEWPWVVSLFNKKKDEFLCSANLISNQHLLTAAHCIYEKQSLGGKNARDIYAFIGRFDITSILNVPKSIKSDIRQIIIHPSWNPRDIRFNADIAILVLRNPISFLDVIQPVCLPNPEFNAFNTTGMVVGYGKSESKLLHETKPRKVRSQESSYQITEVVSAAVVQECGQNDYVLFTNVAKFTNWVSNEVTKTFNSNTFDSVFNGFDEDYIDINSNTIGADCTFRNTGTSYGCHVYDLITPDQGVALKIKV